jgi:hypothetical protein
VQGSTRFPVVASGNDGSVATMFWLYLALAAGGIVLYSVVGLNS